MNFNHGNIGRCFAGIFLLILSVEGYNNGFVDPLTGRMLVNLLPLKGVSTTQFAALSVRVTTLETSLATLTNQVAAAAEKCPASAVAVGAQLIGTFCYSVTTTPTTFLAALTACQAAGGSLAEPLPTPQASSNLYNALKLKFPAQFATIEAANTGQLWIGDVTKAAGAAPFNFLSITTGGIVSPSANSPSTLTTLSTAIGTALAQGALLNNPANGNPYWVPALQTATNPFVCQYTALA